MLSINDDNYIVGVDPSLSNTGVTVISNNNEACYSIKTKPPKEFSFLAELARIESIVSQVVDCFKKDKKPVLVVMEGMAFMAHNTVALIQLSALNYFIRKALKDLDIKFIIVAPTTLKKFITSKGNAHKELILLECYKRWNKEFSDNNIADSYGLAKIAEALLDSESKDAKNLTKSQQEVINLLTNQL
jgi:Holliday junction resolvasome RuvABC endonuclease subunit